MTDGPDDVGPDETLPEARVRRMRWRLSAVWVVPIVAALVAGYLVYGRIQDLGPKITITFRDANGIKPGQTELRYRGVPVGEVTTTTLSEDHANVVVTVRLRRSAASLAREGSLFWIVRPEVRLGAIRGLATVITGPYLQVFPGSGPAQREFAGVDSPPPALGLRGLRITLAAADLGSVKPGSPVYYRGIEVGFLTEIELSRDATRVHVRAFIDQGHARLVRIGSRFWIVSGVDVNVSLFRGLEINLESLRSLVAGGVAFATPDDPNAAPAKDGAVFVLHDKPEKEWLGWSPKLP